MFLHPILKNFPCRKTMGGSVHLKPSCICVSQTSLSVNKLTIMTGICCSRQNECHAVGDLSPHQLLRTVTHGNGMGLEHTHTHTTNPLALALHRAPSDVGAQATRLAQMLYGSVWTTSVLFNSSHVPVDRDHFLWLAAASQQLQRLLTLA